MAKEKDKFIEVIVTRVMGDGRGVAISDDGLPVFIEGDMDEGDEIRVKVIRELEASIYGKKVGDKTKKKASKKEKASGPYEVDGDVEDDYPDDEEDEE